MTEETLFERYNYDLMPDELRAVTDDKHNGIFGWRRFEVKPAIRGFSLKLVDPLFSSKGCLITLLTPDDATPKVATDTQLRVHESESILELNLKISSQEKLKSIQNFICSRYKIKSSVFLKEIKKKSRTQSLLRDVSMLDDSVAGEYYHSHEMKTPIKSIKLFNMNTVKMHATQGPGRINKSESISHIKDDVFKHDTTFNARDRSAMFAPGALDRINPLADSDLSIINDSSLHLNQSTTPSNSRQISMDPDVGLRSRRQI